MTEPIPDRDDRVVMAFVYGLSQPKYGIRLDTPGPPRETTAEYLEMSEGEALAVWEKLGRMLEKRGALPTERQFEAYRRAIIKAKGMP